MGLFGPSKAELKAAAEGCAAETDNDRIAQRHARDERQRAAEWRAAATSRCIFCGRPAPPQMPCFQC